MGTSPPRLPDHTDPEVEPTVAGSSRRRFLTRAAVGGAVLAVGTQLVPAGRLVPAARAQDDVENDEEGETLTPDEALLAHLAGLLLAAAQGYGLAVDPARSSLSEPVTEVVRQLGANHNAQATSLNQLLPVAVDEPNGTLGQQLTTDITAATDEAALLGVLVDLEEALAATEFAMLGEITDQNDAKNVAAILPTANQQAVVLGSLAGTPLTELIPAEQTTEGELTVEAYPRGSTSGSPDAPSETPTGNEGGTGADAGDSGGQEGTEQPGDGTSSSGGGASDGSGTPTDEG